MHSPAFNSAHYHPSQHVASPLSTLLTLSVHVQNSCAYNVPPNPTGVITLHFTPAHSLGCLDANTVQRGSIHCQGGSDKNHSLLFRFAKNIICHKHCQSHLTLLPRHQNVANIGLGAPACCWGGGWRGIRSWSTINHGRKKGSPKWSTREMSPWIIIIDGADSGGYDGWQGGALVARRTPKKSCVASSMAIRTDSLSPNLIKMHHWG